VNVVKRDALCAPSQEPGARPANAGLPAIDPALTPADAPPNIAPLHQHFIVAVDFASLYAPIDADMRAVDAVVRVRLHSDVALVRQVAEYIISAGGKRMRPALVLLAAGACGYSGIRHHELAAVVEFIHTATLLHDDVVDESSLRRGRDTANAVFGNPASVLVGDFLYSRAFQIMVGVGSMRVMQVLADATNIIAEGEVLQLMNCRNADIEVDDYLRVIRYKTAKLFEAAGRLGAILGDASPEIETALADYGMHLGTAFQLIDDVLDYSGQEVETGKHLGDDLAEGKPTLPLIHVIQHGTPQQAALVRAAIENASGDSFAEVLAAVRSSGSLDVARRHGIDEAEMAKAALLPLRESKFRETLLQLADFAVQRSF
jgi:octaprenyl-diphosphate synthase